MKISDLRALTAYHAHVAAARARMADGMGPCLVADQAREDSRQHAEWALKLEELTDAMQEVVRVMAE